jgi:hypothetical protein
MFHSALSGLRALALTASLLCGVAALSAGAQDAPSGGPNAEGLVPVEVRGLQQVLVQPDADLARYRSVLLDPLEISFDRRWDPRPGGRALDVREKTKIRDDLGRVLRKAFVAELEKGGYQIVEQPGDDVLRVRAEIRDLYLNAPDVPRASRTLSYTRSTGEMTLVAELRDSASGSLIARVLDRYEDPEDSWFTWTTQLDNDRSAREAAEAWARALKSQLDRARAVRPSQGLESGVR